MPASAGVLPSCKPCLQGDGDLRHRVRELQLDELVRGEGDLESQTKLRRIRADANGMEVFSNAVVYSRMTWGILFCRTAFREVCTGVKE